MKLQNKGITLQTYPVGSLEVNCTIISSENGDCIAIDPGDNFTQFSNILSSLNLSLIMQIYTHAHFDHIGGAKQFKEKWQAPIALPSEDAPLYLQLREQTSRFGMPILEPTQPDFLLNENSSLECNSNKLNDFLKSLKIIHTPGHTKGSSCFFTEWFDRPLLISGDTLFYQSIGRTDLPGGDYPSIINSITKKLLILPENTLVITGHGPGTTIGNEARLNPFLQGSF